MNQNCFIMRNLKKNNIFAAGDNLNSPGMKDNNYEGQYISIYMKQSYLMIAI